MPTSQAMHSATGRLRTWRKRFFVAFGLAAGMALVLMLFVETRTIGMGLALAAVPMSLAVVAYLLWLSTKTERPVGKWDLHPSRGVLMDIPTTWPTALGHLALYVVAAGVAVLAVVEGLPGDTPEDAIDVAMGGAAFLLALHVFALTELFSAFVVKRWGTTPPGRVTVALMVVVVTAGLATGLPLGSYLVEYLGLVRDFAGSVEYVIWATPVTLAAIVGMTWIRSSMVFSWQRRLDLESHRAREAEQGRKLAEAQLAMMQAQIEPHFLYNTLASVQYLVRRDANAADFLLTQLVRYLRHAMPKLRQPMSTLQQEFELADAYLQIARMRMGGRLTTKVELAEALHSVPFPPLVLQTLVENALKHGVEPKLGPVSVEVGAHVDVREGGRKLLVVEVKDDGVGLGRAETAGTGAGLVSVRERLAAIYGCKADLTVTDLPRGGVLSGVELTLEVAPVTQTQSRHEGQEVGQDKATMGATT